MRLVVLSLALALVVPEFAANKNYVYNYEALLLGGLPVEGLARAGVKVNSKVVISAMAENTFLMKLMDPEIFEYSGAWPGDAFVPATKLTAALAAQLLTPIKFEYANGVVGKVWAPAGVSATVLNVFRGILNIFHMNLKKTQNVYEMQEAGAQGVCKTHYVISEHAEGQHIAVTKSKDLTNCQERIVKNIGLAYREKVLAGAATYNYILKPGATGALVAEATVRELHQFALARHMEGAAHMEARQTIAFAKFADAAVAPAKADYVARGSLQYEFATEILQTPIQLLKINNAKAQIVEILHHLAANNMVMAHEDAPLKFIQMVQLLRFAGMDEIEAIWAQFKGNHAHRQWILNAAPAIGTPVALRFIKEKFVAGEVTIPEATQALVAAVHLVTADAEALAFHPKVQEHAVLREIVMLGYGTFVYKFCAAHPNCAADHIKPIHDLVATAVANGDFKDIGLLLKAVGNAGHPASLKPIMKLLPVFGAAAANLPIRHQVNAILAMRNIAKREPKLVQPVALQLLMDRTLHPEIRMVSCIVLFETRPTIALVATVANMLKRETMSLALSILNPKLDRLGYRFSKAIHADFYHYPLMAGAAASAFFVNDAATVMPRAIVAKARTYFAGAAADFLEVGVRTEGLQEALLKTPGMTENTDRLTKMRRVLKALTQWRALPTSQPLASVYIKLFGQEIAFAKIDKDFIDQAIEYATGAAAHTTLRDAIRALHSGVAIYHAMPMLTAEVRHIFPTAVGVPMELSLYKAAVATANMNVQAGLAQGAAENFHLGNLIQSEVRLQAQITPSVAMHTFAVMGVNTAFIQAAVMARAKVHTALPMKVAAKFDFAKMNFKVEAMPFAVADHIAAIRVQTFAVARNAEDLAGERMTPLVPAAAASGSSEVVYSDVSAEAKPALRAAVPVRKAICFPAAVFGIKACCRITSTNAAFIRQEPLMNLFGDHAVIVAVETEGQAVERVEFEMQIGPEAAGKLVKEIKLSEAATPELSPVLLKLKRLLESGRRNSSSSSSSSSSKSSSSVSSSSASSSSSSSSSQAKYLGENLDPVAVVILRAVKADKKIHGYQAAAYVDHAADRAQIIINALAEDNNWKMCADAVLLSKHKIMAKLAWGVECQEYAAIIKAESGALGPHPAARLKVQWVKIPGIFAHYGKRVADYIPGAAFMAGMRVHRADNDDKAIQVLMAVQAQRVLNIIVKTPKMTLSNLIVHLPITLAIGGEQALQAIQTERAADSIRLLYSAATAAQCSMVGRTLTTFNNRRYNNELPFACYQVLAQDCTPELKFMVLMKKDAATEENHINVKIANIDVDIFPAGSAMMVRVNGMDIPFANLPYKHPAGNIAIRPEGDGLALVAPGHGLEKVYIAKDMWKIEVADWMRGHTCGLCGRADGEIKQEFYTPSSFVTKNAVSFAHSWVLPSQTCRDANQCLMTHKTVKLERNMDGQVSTCYSIEPVLRCLPGCSAVRTVPVTVAFHCLANGDSRDFSIMYDKRVDLRDTSDAHVACRCSEQCA
uniref:Phosvitin n=1 Tax=Denticeps clupeoides TaxID=299321 RepID=A0AAY4DYU4_9TELE